MTVALVIAVLVYLAVASLIALNATLEAERPVLAAVDFVIIAMVSVAWPVAGCALLSAQLCRMLVRGKRKVRPGVR